MMLSNFKEWQAFTFKGKRFLALISKDGSNAHIYDANFNRYGSFFSVKNFKTFYIKHGEKLNLDVPDTFKIEEPQQ